MRRKPPTLQPGRSTKHRHRDMRTPSPTPPLRDEDVIVIPDPQYTGTTTMDANATTTQPQRRRGAVPAIRPRDDPAERGPQRKKKRGETTKKGDKPAPPPAPPATISAAKATDCAEGQSQNPPTDITTTVTHRTTKMRMTAEAASTLPAQRAPAIRNRRTTAQAPLRFREDAGTTLTTLTTPPTRTAPSPPPAPPKRARRLHTRNHELQVPPRSPYDDARKRQQPTRYDYCPPRALGHPTCYHCYCGPRGQRRVATP